VHRFLAWRRLQLRKNGRSFAAHPWLYSLRQSLTIGGVACICAFVAGAGVASALAAAIVAVPVWLLLTRSLIGPYFTRRAG